MVSTFKKINIRSLTCLLALGFYFPSATSAQVAIGSGQGRPENPPVFDAGQLPTMIVTGSRIDALVEDVPNSVIVVDAAKLRDRTVRTLPEALEHQPGIMVQKTAHGQGSPIIRGFTGFRNLLVIDGIRLNNSVFREGPNQYWSTVDPSSLSQLDVVKGQGSVLFGSDAIGGTVNAQTKSALQAANAADGETFAHGGMFYRWASGEQSHVGHIETDLGKGGSYGLHLGFSLKNFGDVRAADIGTQRHTGYGEWDTDAKLEWQIAPDATLTLAYQQVEQDDVWRTHRTIYGVPWEGTTRGSEQKRALDQGRQLGYAQLELADLDSFVESATFSLSWHHQDETQHRIRKIGDGRSDLQGFDVDTLGIWAQFTSDTPAGELLYGASYYRDEVDSFRTNFDSRGHLSSKAIQGPVGDDSSYDLAGAFVQDTLPIGDRLDVIGGVRYTYAAVDVGRMEDPETRTAMTLSDEWNNVSGSGKFLGDITSDETLQWYGGLAQGFRAPNLSDLSRLDTARSNELETAAPDLKPEHYLNYELGIRAQTDRFHGGIACFYTDVRDMIVRTPTGRTVDGNREVTKRNGGDGYVQGIEVDAEWEFLNGLSVFGNFTWMDGEVDTYPTSSPESAREPLDRLMPVTGTLGLHWDATESLWLEVTGTVAAEADRLSSRDRADTQRIPPGGTPGYKVFTARAGWHATSLLLVTAAVENLADEAYRTHGSGQNEPGVNVVLGASLSF